MMDSNQLSHYLRGFFELVDEPTPAQIRAIRNEVLRAQPVTAEIIPVEVVDLDQARHRQPPDARRLRRVRRWCNAPPYIGGAHGRAHRPRWSKKALRRDRTGHAARGAFAGPPGAGRPPALDAPIRAAGGVRAAFFLLQHQPFESNP